MLTDEEVIRLYNKEGKSSVVIGKIYNVHPNKILSILKRHNIQRRNSKDYFIDRRNQQFHKLLVLDEPPEIVIKDNGEKYRKWKCKCECGREVMVIDSNLGRGSKSCGKCINTGSKNCQWTGYEDISGSYWTNLKASAKRRGLEFNLTIQEAWEIFEKQNGKCAYSGLPLEHSRRSRKNQRVASIDRIDSNKGYTKDNIQWLHNTINTMKWNHSEEEFFNLIKTIYHYKGLR